MHDRMVYRESVRSCPCWPYGYYGKNVQLFIDLLNTRTFHQKSTVQSKSEFVKFLSLFTALLRKLSVSDLRPPLWLYYLSAISNIYLFLTGWHVYDLGVKPLCGKHEPGRARQTVCYTTRKRPFRGSRQAQQKITHLLCSWWVLLENLGQRRVNIQGIEIRFRFIWW